MAEARPFGRGRLRRLFGLDRSGTKPRPTRAGEPLRPWTIPNMVGYVRLAALPLFLYLAFESGDGRSAPAAIVFWLIAAGDYLDGFLARVTGQYSRMGALLDPSSTASPFSAAPSSAGTSSCCRAGRWRCSPCASW